MDRPNRICIITDTNFRSVSHYDNPGDVLGDNRLSPGEKRAILSSWASDIYAVESNPALRELPDVRQAIRLTDILSALRELDGQFDPPRGGAAMRTRRPASLDVTGRNFAGPHDRRPSRRSWVAVSG